jgi:hypothetical protein
VTEPTASTEVSIPYPLAPMSKTDRAYAASVTGRFTVNRPNTPTSTVGHNTSGRPAT